MIRNLVLTIALSTLVLTFGCDQMGVTKANDNAKNENLTERMFEYNQTTSMLQKRVIDLENENIRLSSIVAENDLNIKSLQGQLATAEAATQNMIGEISSSKKTKTILGVIAVISLIFNGLFLWIIFGNKKRSIRLALPPAKDDSKKDIDIMKYSPTPPSSDKTNKDVTGTDTIKKAKLASATTTKTKTVTKKTPSKKPAPRSKPTPKKQTEPEQENNNN